MREAVQVRHLVVDEVDEAFRPPYLGVCLVVSSALYLLAVLELCVQKV